MVLVLLAIVPVLGQTLYAASEQRRYEASVVKLDMLDLARIASAEQGRLIDGARFQLVTLARLPELRRADPTACNATFAKLLKRFPPYVTLAAAKPNGDVFCSGLPLPGPVNLADRGYFQRTLRTRDFTVSEYLIGRIGGRATLMLAYPSIEDSGVVRAVVIIGLDLAWLTQAAAKAQLPEAATVTVRDRNGTILAHYPDPKRWVGQTVPEVPVVKAMVTQQREGTAEAPDQDGVPRLYAFARLPSTSGGGDVYVSIDIPTAIAFADVNRRMARNVAWLGMMTAVGLVIAWSFAGLFILR